LRGQHATSALVTIVRADDDVIPGRYLSLVVYGLDRGGPDAVDRLRNLFEDWQAAPAAPHTRVVCAQKIEGDPASYGCEH